MTVIVTDSGFAADDWNGGFCTLDSLPANDCAGVDLPSDAEPEDLRARLEGLSLIRVDFPSFADGRSFSIAAELRRMGYKGRLRAKGHVISDQYAMARRVGFDEVEIDAALAARQPEAEWLFRANWAEHDYQARLRG